MCLSSLKKGEFHSVMRHTFNSQHLLVSRVTLYLPAELGIVMRAEIVINSNNDRSSESHGWWRLHYFKF